MTINLTLVGEGGVEVRFHEKVSPPAGYNLAKDDVYIDFEGKISKQGEMFILQGMGVGRLVFRCDKCLDAVETNVAFNVLERFTMEEQDEPHIGSVWFVPEETVDTGMYLMLNLYENLPMKVLCSEDCQGLCFKCGANLNKEDCGCDRVQYDPRFEVLRSLFDDKEV